MRLAGVVYRYLVYVVATFVLLVIMARSGNMPVIVPESVSDFLLDVSDRLLDSNTYKRIPLFIEKIVSAIGLTQSESIRQKGIDEFIIYFKERFNILFNRLDELSKSYILQAAYFDYIMGNDISGALYEMADYSYYFDSIIIIDGQSYAVFNIGEKSDVTPFISTYKDTLNSIKEAAITYYNGRYYLIYPFIGQSGDNKCIAALINNNYIQKSIDMFLYNNAMVVVFGANGKVIAISTSLKQSIGKDKIKNLKPSNIEDVVENEGLNLNIYRLGFSYLLINKENAMNVFMLYTPSGLSVFITAIIRIAIAIAILWLLYYWGRIIYKHFIEIRSKREETLNRITSTVEESISLSRQTIDIAREVASNAKKEAELVLKAVELIKAIRMSPVIVKQIKEEVIAPKAEKSVDVPLKRDEKEDMYIPDIDKLKITEEDIKKQKKQTKKIKKDWNI